MEEIFKPIEGYEGIYEISNLGRIKSISRTHKKGKKGVFSKSDKILSTSNHGKSGYKSVHLKYGEKENTLLVHRLVAIHFIPNPENKPQVNHINGKKDDNSVDNLEWATGLENTHHSIYVLNRRPKKVNIILTDENIVEIRKLYKDGGYFHKHLALKYGVSRRYIGDIINYKKRTLVA